MDPEVSQVRKELCLLLKWISLQTTGKRALLLIFEAGFKDQSIFWPGDVVNNETKGTVLQGNKQPELGYLGGRHMDNKGY